MSSSSEILLQLTRYLHATDIVINYLPHNDDTGSKKSFNKLNKLGQGTFYITIYIVYFVHD